MEDALQYDLCPNCKLNVPYRAKKCPHCHEWMPTESSAISKKLSLGISIVWIIFLIWAVATSDKTLEGSGYVILTVIGIGSYFVIKGLVDRFINWIR